MFDTDIQRWEAVRLRRPEAKAAFVYAVTSTHIFCRPNCPARLARRANVRFYDNAAMAANAGFRPCKRCKPCQANEDAGLADTVHRIRAMIEQRNGRVTLAALSKDMELSARYLYGLFKRFTGVTPSAYASNHRQMQSDRCKCSTMSPVGSDLAHNLTPSTLSLRQTILVSNAASLAMIMDAPDNGDAVQADCCRTSKPMAARPQSLAGQANGFSEIDDETHCQNVPAANLSQPLNIGDTDLECSADMIFPETLYLAERQQWPSRSGLTAGLPCSMDGATSPTVTFLPEQLELGHVSSFAASLQTQASFPQTCNLESQRTGNIETTEQCLDVHTTTSSDQQTRSCEQWEIASKQSVNEVLWSEACWLLPEVGAAVVSGMR